MPANTSVPAQGLRQQRAAQLRAEMDVKQRAVAHVALDANNTLSLRVAAFGALAESARNNGNMLEESQIDTLVKIAREESDLVIRTSSSQALGAVNIATNKAGEIIRGYYGG